ncbi:hypothetical protein EYZ11_013564 [Aspergillus tanneri]|nr:hypothetical protein EYZ11_013564 [Aspergillus tanneri]
MLDRFDMIERLWRDNPQLDVLDSIDLIEVTDFVWGFLVRKLFYDPQKHLPWVPNEMEDVYREPEWEYFIMNLLSYIRPPNVVELLLLHHWGSEVWPRNRSHYLLELGFLNVPQVFSHPAEHPDNSYPLEYLEDNMINKLQKLYQRLGVSKEHLELAWEQYRDPESWAQCTKGRVFSFTEGMEIATEILNF